MPIAAAFAITQPCTDKRDDRAIVVSEQTAEEAVAEVERPAARLHGFGLTVDERRR